MSSSSSSTKRKFTELEEGWEIIHKGIKKVIEGLPEPPKSTIDENMLIYTTIFNMCTEKLGVGDTYAVDLYNRYKQVFEDYITSTVLPSLRENQDELFLKELHDRWTNHKTMTRCLSRMFRYLDRYDIPRKELPSLEDTAFLSFYNLVYDEMHKQAMDAVLAMICRKHAGEEIDETLVHNTLSFYSEIGERARKKEPKLFALTMIEENAPFYCDEASNLVTGSSSVDNTPKKEKMHDESPSPSTVPSKKMINLISSDGVAFEVEYDVAIMSKTVEDAIETNPTTGEINSIPLSLVHSTVLSKIIEYCQMHKNIQISEDYLKVWDEEFANIDCSSLFHLVLTSHFMNISCLSNLVYNKMADNIKGKTPREIAELFGIPFEGTSNSQEEENKQ